MRRKIAVAGVTALALAVPAAAPALASAPRADRLERAITLDGLLQQTGALQDFADVSAGTRVAGSAGHALSAGYVAGQLRSAGYDPTLQQFEFPFFQETAPLRIERIAPTPAPIETGADAVTMTYSGSGDVTATVQGVDLTLPPTPDPSSTSGCEAADFAGFTAGNIALLQRGTCSFQLKAENAQAAGASAALIFNEGQPGRTEVLSGTLGAPTVSIPVVGLTFDLGVTLNEPDTVVHVTTATVSETRTTFNVIAETKGGRADNVVMLGAHLDSVAAGPGINDNGSGSAALIEIARQLPSTIEQPRNKVRFAWWSAEEFGLLGSAHYVSELSTGQAGDIALYLNFDMIASPNFGRFVYDGDDSDQEGAGPGPQGSAAIETVFTDYFAGRGLSTEGTDFDGRSDYGPFIDAGIPAGGLFTGAEDVKTAEQQVAFGGTAGQPFDACYHQACDTSRNLNNTAFLQNAKAAAHATAVFARDTSAVNGRTKSARGLAPLAATSLAGLPRGVVSS